MSQISPPFRIALLAMLAVCAVWFTVLKPKTPAAVTATPKTTAATAPGVTGLANDVNAAKDAAKTSDAANARLQNATGDTAAQTDTSAAAKPKSAGAQSAADKTAAAKAVPAKKAPATKAAADADVSAPLLTALDEHKAVVLVFYNDKGSVDRAVRTAADRVSRHDGKVVVKAAPVSEVGRYTAITQGVQVMQAPTTLVLAPGNTARTIVGFTTENEIEQLVSGAVKAKAGK